jgi:F-box interacting protein
MDMDGNVIRVIKTSRAFELLSTSQHDLICTRGYSFFADVASVIDPATGKVLEDIYDESLTRHIDMVFGFGRAVPSSVYKMVRLWCRRTWECHILTLGDDTGWRPSEMPPIPVTTSPVAVNGVMYFLVFENQHNDTLLPFDLNSEKWEKMIEGPGKVVGPKLWKKRVTVRITELNGSLCMVQSEGYNHQYTNIWLLTNKDLWIKAYTISMALTTHPCTPLTVTRDGGKLIFSCILTGDGLVVRVYDPHTNTCTTLWKLDADVDRIIGLCGLSLERFASATT